ncbi:hypothetical protein QLQ12_26980, partial [Actinoplanes sp. NEAU-A12]|nr:hypothetical protein [Actinoplanes sandaracinus]
MDFPWDPFDRGTPSRRAGGLAGDAVASVRVDAGMPAVQADGEVVRVVVDAAGGPAWRPPA